MGYDDAGHWSHCPHCDALLFDGRPSCEEHDGMRREIHALVLRLAKLERVTELGEKYRSGYCCDFKFNDASCQKSEPCGMVDFCKALAALED